MILIYEKINNVRKLVDYVKKDATVQGYKAVSHDAVTGMIREALVSEGVLVFPSLIVSEDHATGQSTKSGAQFHRYKALYEVKFVAAEDASEVSINVEAHADDHGDKAPGKALSYATKYAMLKVFSIETGEDDESRQDSAKSRAAIQAQARVVCPENKDLWGRAKAAFNKDGNLDNVKAHATISEEHADQLIEEVSLEQL